MCQTLPEAFHRRVGEQETNTRWGHRHIRGGRDFYPHPLGLKLSLSVPRCIEAQGTAWDDILLYIQEAMEFFQSVGSRALGV